jgi:GDPmannose 4,6-dehydratase
MKRAFITGVTGQDGSLLADLLLVKGYEVHGLVRQSTQFTPDKWGYLRGAMNGGLIVHHGDLTDATMMRTLIEEIKPDEVYNLAAQSHVGQSFDQPINTVGVTAVGPLNLLEAIRRSGSKAHFYEASSSEMFGKVQETPQSETTRFYPRSPYGCAKVFGHYITQNYREAYGIFACSGILFNHESERRGENFVTRKITRAVGRIKHGLQKELVLGPLDTQRDWGYAPDYVEAMWLMLQQSVPEDFVIGTGIQHSVQDFVDEAFAHVGLNPKDYVKQDPKFMRPSEVDTLRADASRAKSVLNWQPRVNFKNLVRRMVDHDMELAGIEAPLVHA